MNGWNVFHSFLSASEKICRSYAVRSVLAIQKSNPLSASNKMAGGDITMLTKLLINKEKGEKMLTTKTTCYGAVVNGGRGE